MKIKEKVYVVVDKDGHPCGVCTTRMQAREYKRDLNSVPYPELGYPHRIIQYKRWKKVS